MIKATIGDKSYQVEFDDHDTVKGTIDGIAFQLDILKEGNNRFHIIKNNKSYNVQIIGREDIAKTMDLMINGNTYTVKLADKYDQLLEKMGMSSLTQPVVKELKAPMPGMVLEIIAQAGATIKAGEPLLILEAMKMENIIKSPTDVIIKNILTKTGNTVEKNELLIEFEA